MLGLIGKKLGMIRVFFEKYKSTPVTLIKIFDSYLVRKKNVSKDSYNSYQVLYNISNKKYNYNKPLKKYLYKHNLNYYGYLKEFRINYDFYNLKNKDILPLNLFYINQLLKITSKTIGKGFSGVIKKYGFRSSPSSHGNSKSEKKPGSIGMCQDPGRVLKGKKMAGRLGNKKNTIINLKLKKIDFENGVFYINGSISGKKNSIIFINPMKVF